MLSSFISNKDFIGSTLRPQRSDLEPQVNHYLLSQINQPYRSRARVLHRLQMAQGLLPRQTWIHQHTRQRIHQERSK